MVIHLRIFYLKSEKTKANIGHAIKDHPKFHEHSKMNFKIKTDCCNVDWQTVAGMLEQAGMAYHRPEIHRRAFEASHVVVFVYDNARLLGFGRAISDGEYQGAVYDVAVLPAVQGKGIGTIIMQTIMEALPGCNLILYATPGNENFYRKLGFKFMKTGMAIFADQKGMEKFTL